MNEAKRIMTPADHADAILAWFQVRDPQITIPNWLFADDLLSHADALADAADSSDETLRNEGLRALFAGVVEPLNDGFTPAGRALYAHIFARVVWRVAARDTALRNELDHFGVTDEAHLRLRYAQARADTGVLPTAPRRIAVLSRVTIGADILLTSLVLQRLHQAHPQARIDLVGDAKLGPLLGDLPGVHMLPVAYGRRGPLRERLSSWLTVSAALRDYDLVVAPDSRLDQLGILPVTQDPSRYALWENTLPDDQPPESLADRLDAWLSTRFAPVWGRRCTPCLGLDQATREAALRWQVAWNGRRVCAVKFDHGGNPAKALPREHEVTILHRLRELGWTIVIDRGFGEAECANSDALLAAARLQALDVDDSGKHVGIPVTQLSPSVLANADVVRFHGSIAGWAAAVTTCGHAVSYDSVGHHLAAAAGVPVTVAFTGHSDARFPIAWQPRGRADINLVVIPTSKKSDAAQLARVLDALPKA